MWNVSGRCYNMRQMASVLLQLSADTWRFLVLCLRPAPALAADILFLRKQLALYEERQVKPRRATNAVRLAMVWLSHWFDWRHALRIVKPETFARWHRQGFRLFWRWQSKPGRPRIPTALQRLIKQMAQDTPPGVRSGSPTNCCSSSVCESRQEPCGNTCQVTTLQAQASAVNLNGGPRLSA